MDTKISLEDQFSKLHPCFPANTRIGIVGAGPSGLSAAYALAKLGYRNVTVLEKCKNVSGMCESYEIEGFVRNIISLSKSNGKSSARWPDLPWIHTDGLIKNSRKASTESSEDVIDHSEPQPSDLCFLQFTSGSTGEAKGVMITHGGLIHNVKLMRRRYKSTSRTVLVSWLPQYHDMGLIGGLFTALVSGGTAVLFSPMTFIKNPLLWLQTMSSYRATHSAGPNFAFELVIRRLESGKQNTQCFDLSSMAFLMVAAEPVRQKTLKKFVELCHPFGLSQMVMAPGYGLAENCVFVSCAYGQGKPILIDWQGRVCCGYIDRNSPDVDVRIVDQETGIEHEEHGKEGEVWISCMSSGVGYWGKHELSQMTFHNELQTCPGKAFTRTGDLGRIIDGNLFITGRIKDLIIVAGRNIYSADVEKTIEPPLTSYARGVPEEILSSKGISVPETTDQVGLVVIAEVREDKRVDKEVVEKIQASVAEEHGVPVAAVRLIKPRTICTCTEGRTPRPQLGKKPPLPQRVEFGMNEIIGFLKELVSEQTGISIDKITETESLVSYGIDSIGVVRASQKLSDFLGVPIGAMDIFTATCIEDLASFSEGLVMKSKPQSATDPLLAMDPEPELHQPDIEITKFRQFGIGILQIFALIYASAILLLPAYISASAFKNMCFGGNSHLNYLTPLFLAPLAWILQISLTCISISLFGNSFLQVNYALTPEASICSIDFVKWWALYKAQEVAGKVFAVHLRGTVFLNYWFEMLGARIGSSVIIDTIDITDPSLVSIGDGAVIAEGALVQGHEVKDGMIRFQPVKIGRKSSVGPYAVIQNGSIVGEESQEITERSQEKHLPLHQFMAIYTVGLLSSLSAAIPYFLYIWFTKTSPHPQHFTFLCIAGAFHWFPSVIAAYATMFVELPISPSTFAFYVATVYLIHGVLLCILTAVVTRTLSVEQKCLRPRLITACHVRFAKFLSGTEALCVYLRLLGAEIGQHCSIRAINPVVDPGLVSIGDGVHLGDFSRIVTGVRSHDGLHCAKVEIGENSIIGSQALVLAGSVIQADVVLGALSVAPSNTILQRGGVFVGSQAPVMVKNVLHESDERIDEMDTTYKKIIGNLAGNLAITTMKVKSRYFHRIGVGGRGIMKVFDDLPMFPDHEIFRAGKSFPVIVRHSNSLSADDDARIDARGAALRILSEGPDETPLLDLTLKTGKAFYARTIADFARWLVCGLPAREELVKRAPHIGDAVWGSLRNASSYAELHYYSNFCRLLRFVDSREMYAKFKLRPADASIGEDSGAVVPKGILPPETGAIPRDEHDNRPMLFLAEDFRRRVERPGGVRYVFQMQIRPVPSNEAGRDSALDCTCPWDESSFPYIDIGEVMLDHNLTTEESERLEFNPFQRCAGVDVIRATSCTSSASIDHGRSLVYEICQRLRNGVPLPAAWRGFLEQSDAKVDLSGCPISAPATKTAKKPTLARSWHQTFWTASAQPVLQTFLPYFILATAASAPLQVLMSLKGTLPLQLLLPLFWVASGALALLACVASKWVLVGKRNEGEAMPMWGFGAFADTAWQAIRTVTGDYFGDMTCGSAMFAFYMRLMGSDIGGGVYVDSAQAVMNPEMVEIGLGGCVGRDAALFGHIYEGEGGMVRFGKVRVGALECG
ncbi:4-coumarate--CoA ligase-like 1 [Acorus calamus]|uniref:4-coumarate--CoA ligase n=1 Tax=Acorus calamus TaxID=4465 RepID=A0AAV9CIU7_ACOCL|nr:4-coumarate--CoA ligase-like 1 [Acorus calamus]